MDEVGLVEVDGDEIVEEVLCGRELGVPAGHVPEAVDGLEVVQSLGPGQGVPIPPMSVSNIHVC